MRFVDCTFLKPKFILQHRYLTHIRLALFCGTWTNSTGQDQTPQSAMSDQVLYCLLTEFSIKIWIRMKNNTNNPEDENRLVHLIKVGSFIRLKRVNEMVTFIIHFGWFCNVIEHWNRILFPRFFMVIWGLFKYECKWLHNFLHIYATTKGHAFLERTICCLLNGTKHKEALTNFLSYRPLYKGHSCMLKFFWGKLQCTFWYVCRYSVISL